MDPVSRFSPPFTAEDDRRKNRDIRRKLMGNISIIMGIILGIILLIISNLTGWKLWILLIISFPVLFIVFVAISIYKNTSSSVNLEEIPQGKFTDRINELNRRASGIHSLGFRKIDHFLVKIFPEAIVYILKNDEKHCIACLYNIQTMKAVDFITSFKGNYSITTSSILEAAKFPLDEKSMMQGFPKQSVQNIFEAHIRAVDFVVEKRLEIFDMPDEEFRDKFKESLINARKRLRSYKYWPLLILYRSFVNDSKSYAKPIEEQYKEGRYKFLGEV